MKSEILQQVLEAFTVFGSVNGIRRRTDNVDAVGFQGASEFKRCLAAILNNDAFGFFDIDDFEHVFERDRFKVQPVARVVVGGHRFRVAVDHDGFITVFAERHRGMNAAIIKLDTLTDTVGATAQNHDLAAIRRINFRFFLVGRIHVSGIRREFACAGIHAFVDRTNSEFVTTSTNLVFLDLQKLSNATIGEAFLLEEMHFFLRELRQAVFLETVLNIDKLFNLNQEPRINPGGAMSFFDGVAQTESVGQVPKTVGARFTDLVVDRSAISRDFV